jgi:hypothetical protein
MPSAWAHFCGAVLNTSWQLSLCEVLFGASQCFKESLELLANHLPPGGGA